MSEYEEEVIRAAVDRYLTYKNGLFADRDKANEYLQDAIRNLLDDDAEKWT